MAAIDKLFLNDYSDIVQFKKWATIYYPKVFSYWYDGAFNLTFDEFQRHKESYAREAFNNYQKTWRLVASDGTINSAISHYISKGYSEKDAEWEAEWDYDRYKLSYAELYKEADYPIMNTPFRVDKILKWICPVPCIRQYLQKQCGVKEHWYYKIFWKGKSCFQY